jgi:hypothetical protein
MILTIIPQGGRPRDAISVSGETLTIGAASYDLSSVTEGMPVWFPAEPEHVFTSRVSRQSGVLHVSIIWHCGMDCPAGEPWTVEVASGAVPLPEWSDPQ